MVLKAMKNFLKKKLSGKIFLSKKDLLKKKKKRQIWTKKNFGNFLKFQSFEIFQSSCEKQ